MDIRTLFFEARRNPDVNAAMRFKDVVKYFEPHFGRKDAYVSMINVPKVGIHPSSGHDTTPTAIYCYPLSQIEIMRQFDEGKLPYMGWARYAALIIEKPGLKKLSCDMTEAEADATMAKLDEMMNAVIPPEVWSRLKIIATRTGGQAHEHYGYLFTCTHAAAAVLGTRMEYAENERLGVGDHRDTLHYFYNVLEADDFVSKMRGDSKTRPRVWNSLLRRLGYDAIEDKGTRFIFNIEPIQTGFLHMGCVQHYEIFRNGLSSIYGHTDKKHHEIQSANHFMTLVRKGEIGTKDALTFMDHMLRGEDLPATEDKHQWYSYNPAIRLSHGQIRRTFDFLKQKDGVNVGQWLTRAAMFASIDRNNEKRLYNVLIPSD